MNAFPKRYVVDKIKNNFPVGTQGTVKFVDDIGTIHITWDCGSSLGIVYGEDSCHRI